LICLDDQDLIEHLHSLILIISMLLQEIPRKKKKWHRNVHPMQFQGGG